MSNTVTSVSNTVTSVSNTGTEEAGPSSGQTVASYSPDSSYPPVSVTTGLSQQDTTFSEGFIPKLVEEDPLRLFVTLLMVQLMDNCHAINRRNSTEWVAHTKRLVDQILVGLNLYDDTCPTVKHVNRTYKKAESILLKHFCGKLILHSVLLLQDPVVDNTITTTLRNEVKKQSEKLSKTTCFGCC